MKVKVTEYDHLQALPICVVLRTARGVVVERGEYGWAQMGSEGGWTFDKRKDFPCSVLWTYADEIIPPDIDPDMAVEFVRQLRQKANEQQAQQAHGDPGVDFTGNNDGVYEGKQNTQPVNTEAGIQHDGDVPRNGADPVEHEIIQPERRGPLG